MHTFKFEDLTEPAKQQVRDWYAEHTDNSFAEPVIDGAKEAGLERGFHISDTFWRGFWSQGDGASWHGVVLTKQFLDFHLKPDHPDYARYIVLLELVANGLVRETVTVSTRGFMYAHSNMMYAEGPALEAHARGERMSIGILEGAGVQELMYSIDINRLVDDLNVWILTEARSYADDIYKQLEKEYDHQMSDDNIKEMAEINEWLFDEDGHIV